MCRTNNLRGQRAKSVKYSTVTCTWQESNIPRRQHHVPNTGSCSPNLAKETSSQQSTISPPSPESRLTPFPLPAPGAQGRERKRFNRRTTRAWGAVWGPCLPSLHLAPMLSQQGRSMPTFERCGTRQSVRRDSVGRWFQRVGPQAAGGSSIKVNQLGCKSARNATSRG